MTLLISFLILYFSSDGRLLYIFTPYTYKCGMVKLLQKERTDDNSPIDISSIYPTNYDAGSSMHGCGKPKEYLWKNLHCKLDGGTYKCEESSF